MKNETRFGIECRSQLDGNRLVGVAAVFGQYAKLPGYLECLHRNAFDKVLASPDTDVRALVEHDPNKLLGRQSSGTLKLEVTDEGLAFEVDLPDTSYGRDIRELVSRGDLTGASFGVVPGEDEWSRTTDGLQLRTHTSVEMLRDISVVSFPAYSGASVMLRSLDKINLLAPPESLASQLIRARSRVLLGRQ